MPILASAAPAEAPGEYEQAGRELDTLVAAQQATIEALTKHTNELAGQILEPIPTHIQQAPGEITLAWDDVPGTVNYSSGRDGVDTKGNGPTFFLEKPTIHSRRFIWCTPGVAYTLTVVALPSGRVGTQTVIAL